MRSLETFLLIVKTSIVISLMIALMYSSVNVVDLTYTKADGSSIADSITLTLRPTSYEIYDTDEGYQLIDMEGLRGISQGIFHLMARS